jgi:XRE family aerobic/anaerobic benzoate catabolism transcriptional regulator
MSSTILHELEVPGIEAPQKNPFLVALGERVRALRARRGMTRKAVALAANVSERHLANLEYGEGNASILVLLQVAGALQCSLAELIGDISTSSPEWLLIRELLQHCDEAALRRVRISLADLLGTGASGGAHARVALIGLRGAGKSTLGAMLAEDLGFPFVELSRDIEKFAGCSVAEIQALYGVNAYRRYERRALEEAIQIYPEAVIATPGGLVSDPANFNLLLAHCSRASREVWCGVLGVEMSCLAVCKGIHGSNQTQLQRPVRITHADQAALGPITAGEVSRGV